MRLSRFSGAVTLPLCLALAGCSLTRPPAAVPPPVPAQWNAPLPPPGPAAPPLPVGSIPALTDWWRQLNDPLLDRLIAAAQDESPTIASAAARIAEARATRVQSGAALLPSLDASLTGTRGNSGSRFGASPTGGLIAIPITTTQATLQSSWEADLFGRLRSDREAAQTRLVSADAKWHDARVSVAAETANAYFAERACIQQLTVSESDTRSRSETARLSDLSSQAGFTAPADAALARASASDASGRLSQQRAQCDVQRKALVALTGIDEPELAAQLAASPVQQALPNVQAVASVPADMLVQRPDVYANELGVAAASAEVGSAEAARYPRLTLQGSVGRTTFRLAGQEQSLDTWSIGPVTLTVPLFDGGTRRANVESAKARYAEAVAVYRGSVRQAVREVEEALVNLQSTDARASDADSAVKNYQAAFDAMQARYKSGLASLIELEDVRRTLYAAQTARVALQRERANAWVALYRTTGGGWTRAASLTSSSAAPSP